VFLKEKRIVGTSIKMNLFVLILFLFDFRIVELNGVSIFRFFIDIHSWDRLLRQAVQKMKQRLNAISELFAAISDVKTEVLQFVC